VNGNEEESRLGWGGKEENGLNDRDTKAGERGKGEKKREKRERKMGKDEESWEDDDCAADDVDTRWAERSGSSAVGKRFVSSSSKCKATRS
jgi:hypothetical protein